MLIDASDAITGGAKRDHALKNAGVWDNRIPLFRSALARCSSAHLRMLLYQAAAVDRGIKGMRQANVWDEMVTLILSFAGHQTLQPINIKLLLAPKN